MAGEIVESMGISVVWMIIGICLSMALVKIYDVIVFRKFDLEEAIEEKNSAVAIFFGMMLLGIGLVVAATIMSPGAGSLLDDVIETVGWSVGISFVATILFFAFDKLLLPKTDLQEAISNGNVASGILSGIVYVTVSIVAMAVIIT